MLLWCDTAPDLVAVQVRQKPRARRSLKVWNVWRTGTDVTHAWLRNAAMQVEGEPTRRLTLRCSDGIGDPTFDDLIVKMEA